MEWGNNEEGENTLDTFGNNASPGEDVDGQWGNKTYRGLPAQSNWKTLRRWEEMDAKWEEEVDEKREAVMVPGVHQYLRA